MTRERWESLGESTPVSVSVHGAPRCTDTLALAGSRTSTTATGRQERWRKAAHPVTAAGRQGRWRKASHPSPPARRPPPAALFVLSHVCYCSIAEALQAELIGYFRLLLYFRQCHCKVSVAVGVGDLASANCQVWHEPGCPGTYRLVGMRWT